MRATRPLPPLTEIVRIHQRGTRSVNVERDLGQVDVAQGYVLTAQARLSLARILERIVGPGAVRAWTLTGPYGSGKSYFGLFLMNLLSGSSLSHEHALEQLIRVDPLLAESVKTAVGFGKSRGFLPIAVTGYRTTIQDCIRQGLRRVLDAYSNKPDIKSLLERPELWSEDAGSRAIIDAIQEMARIFTAQDFGFRGIVMILDEMGKPLEYAAAHPADSDLYLLQELAEFANHSTETPLVFVGILHQSFDRYAGHADSLSQREWAKIQGRFEDIAFQEPPNQQLWLLANTLEHTSDTKTLERAWPDAQDVAQFAAENKLYPATLKQSDFLALCARTLPFHPSAMVALPYLFRRLAQNERSMFAYLTSLEPRGFQEYLTSRTAPDRIRLVDLFDYIAANFQSRLYSSLRARSLTEALEKIESNPTLEPIATDALKTIGLLNWLAEIGPFQTTIDNIAFAMRSSERTDEQIRDVLHRLQRQSMVVFRRFNQTYAIWQGSDVDIEERIEEARQRQLAGFSTAYAVQQYLPPQPIVARRHSYNTGTSRFFEARYIDSSEQLDAALTAGEGASGLVVLCISASVTETDNFVAWARSEPFRRRVDVVVGVLTRTPRLAEMLKEIHCLHWVHDNTPELRDDPVARRELRTRLNELETIVLNELDGTLRIQRKNDETGYRWYHCGEDVSHEAQRGISYLLSQVCDRLFEASPIIRNEILNRRQLSSQGAAARRNLIEAMLRHADQATLGIEGFPPERSMYESVLRAGGLHLDLGEQWGFSPPSDTDPLRLSAVWNAISDYVFSLPPQPRSVQTLFDLLSRPPFGLTDGVLPVLLCAFLIVHQEEATLYREGSLLPMPEVSDWEVLLRRPELYSVAGCRIVGPRIAVVERLARGLQTKPAAMPIVRELVRRLKTLPEHVWRTQRLSPNALAMRKAVEMARSPENLLFHELPLALGIEPFAETKTANAEQVELFFVNLNTALQEMADVMPSLLAEARDQLLEVSGLPPGEEGWQQFMTLAAELSPKVNQPTLAPLLHCAGNTTDARAALESTLAYVVNRPPRAWSDGDREQFSVKAQTYGELFRRERNGHVIIVGLTVAQQESVQRLTDELSGHLQEALKTDPLAVQAAVQVLLDELRQSYETTSKNGVAVHE